MIARSPTPSLSAGLLSLIDDAAYTAAALDAASRVLDSTTIDTTWARAKVEQAAARTAALRDATQILSRAQLATLLASQTSDLARLPATAATQPAAAALVNQAVALAAQLGIHPADANARNRIISDAAKLLSQSKPVDFPAAADEFAAELPASANRQPFLRERLEVAAQSESLRSDAELVRAADLALAARAAGAAAHLPPGPQLDHFKQSFPQALRTLARDHEARRLPAPPADWDAIATAAESARQTLRELAAAPDNAPVNPAERTLTANAQLAPHPPKPTTQISPTPIPPIAAEAEKLQAQQDSLREKPSPDSAKAQAAVAAEIEKLRHTRQASRAADHRADVARDLSQADDVAQKLSQQMTSLRDAANRARDLATRAQRAAQAAAKATPQSIEPAEELAADLASRAALSAKILPPSNRRSRRMKPKKSPAQLSEVFSRLIVSIPRRQSLRRHDRPGPGRRRRRGAAESSSTARVRASRRQRPQRAVDHALDQLARGRPPRRRSSLIVDRRSSPCKPARPLPHRIRFAPQIPSPARPVTRSSTTPRPKPSPNSPASPPSSRRPRPICPPRSGVSPLPPPTPRNRHSHHRP